VDDFCGEGLEGVDCCPFSEGERLCSGGGLGIEVQGGLGEIEGVDY
jgi:hypothetical protein